MELLSTGQIFLLCGVGGLLVTTVAAVVTGRRLRRTEHRLREQIWREYR